MNTILADLDEIVFKPRNKEYGAYVLRKSSKRSTMLAFFLGVSSLGLMLAIPMAADFLSKNAGGETIVTAEAVATLTEPPPINEEEIPEEVNVPPPPPPQRAEVKFTPPEVVVHEEAPPEVTIVEVEKLDTMKADIGDQDVEGDLDAPPSIVVENEGKGTKPVEIAPVKEKDPDPNAFIAVEQQPTPVNLSDIQGRIVYPPMLKDAGIGGKVFIKILVDKTGKPEKHLVVRSPHQQLTDACVKEIYSLSFKPAIQAGKPIKFWAMVPFDFKLK